jgi:hypothetical protein
LVPSNSTTTISVPPAEEIKGKEREKRGGKRGMASHVTTEFNKLVKKRRVEKEGKKGQHRQQQQK